MKTRNMFAAATLAALTAGALTGPAVGQSAEEFYKGRTINIIVGYGPGGGFDRYARVFAEYFPKHLPGVDKAIVQNMPGAGSMKAANYTYNAAPQDGTYLVIFNENVTLNQVLEPKGMKVDVRKFQWLGRMGMRPTTGIVLAKTGVKTIDDIRRIEVVMGSTSGNDYGTQVDRALNAFLGTRFKPVHGYKGTSAIWLAMDQGEVQGMSIAAAEDLLGRRKAWLKDGKIVVVHMNAMQRLPQFPDVPTIVELAKTKEQRQIMTFLASKIEIGRGFVAGPKVPKDRVALMRKAFDATMQDKGLLAAAKKARIDISPMSADKLEAMIADVIDMPAPLVTKMKALLIKGKGK